MIDEAWTTSFRQAQEAVGHSFADGAVSDAHNVALQNYNDATCPDLATAAGRVSEPWGNECGRLLEVDIDDIPWSTFRLKWWQRRTVGRLRPSLTAGEADR